jgi:hypothetical protein
VVVQHLLFAALVTITLIGALVLGWYELFRAHVGRHTINARHKWVYCALLVLIIASAPLAPVVFVRGMERYARVPFVPWVLPLKR